MLVEKQIVRQKGFDPCAVHSVNFGQHRDSFLFRQCVRTAKRFVRMLLKYPDAKLAPNFRLTDTFNDLDARFAQDECARAVDARMRIAHAYHNAGNATFSNRS